MAKKTNFSYFLKTYLSENPRRSNQLGFRPESCEKLLKGPNRQLKHQVELFRNIFDFGRTLIFMRSLELNFFTYFPLGGVYFVVGSGDFYDFLAS